MRQIYFGDFHDYVLEHIKDIESNELDSYTTEWFLVRYLKRITKVTIAGNLEHSRVEGLMRSLIRFYVDNVEEQSDLGERCLKIHNKYRTTIRKQQSSKYS
jgi:hypothetical protein